MIKLNLFLKRDQSTLRNLRWTSLPGTLKEGKAINKIIKSNLLTDKSFGSKYTKV